MELIQTVGRRKTSVARLLLSKGNGKITINEKDYKDYFRSPLLHGKVSQPLKNGNCLEKFDITVLVTGGGITGQSEAVRLAVSRAMVTVDPETKKALRAEGLMTRDARAVERKKSGRKKARKRFQFTKR